MSFEVMGDTYFRILGSLLSLSLIAGCSSSSGTLGEGNNSGDSESNDTFGNAQQVFISGYPTAAFEHIQEPFISRDGQYFYYNSGENKKDLLYAKWDANHSEFVFQGEVQGVNTSDQVEGNPTIDRENILYYIDTNAAPCWVSYGTFDPVTSTLNHKASLTGLPVIEIDGTTVTGNMGVEVSPDGNTLYFSRAVFENAGTILQTIPESDIYFATKVNDTFVYNETTANRIMQHINTEEYLEYAAGISEDGLEFFFTRTDPNSLDGHSADSQIMRAVRVNISEPFGVPAPVGDIANHEKFVEGPTIYSDTLYYHQFDDGIANLYSVMRK